MPSQQYIDYIYSWKRCLFVYRSAECGIFSPLLVQYRVARCHGIAPGVGRSIYRHPSLSSGSAGRKTVVNRVKSSSARPDVAAAAGLRQLLFWQFMESVGLCSCRNRYIRTRRTSWTLLPEHRQSLRSDRVCVCLCLQTTSDKQINK